MTIQLTIKDEWIKARKTGDKATAANFGLAYDALQKAAKEKQIEVLTDEDAIVVLRKYDGALKEEQAGFARRNETAKVESLEISQKQIAPFIPVLMDKEAVRNVILNSLADGGSGSITKKELMPRAMAELKGKAEGKVIAEVVNELFK